MKCRLRQWSTPLLVIFLMIPMMSGGQLVQAQSGKLSVDITYPSEGETFYAGPNALLYSVRVTGHVTGGDGTQPIQIRLELLQGGTVTGSQDTLTQEDGKYEFDITVNPNGVQRGFITFERECVYCHFKSELSFPPGLVLLRVTATTITGQSAMVERNIVIDRSDFAQVSVQVVPVEPDNSLPTGLSVNASTWLYLWRARTSSGLVDEYGMALVQLEALSEASTSYVFQLGPELVDGKLYESIEPVEVVLTPGATTAEPIMLRVRSRWGNIKGQLVGMTTATSTQIDAIYLIDGRCYSTEASSSGTFIFNDVPIGPYLITADPEALSQQTLVSESQLVDLQLQPNGAGTVSLPLMSMQRPAITGIVVGDDGEWLPFAWISVDTVHQSSIILPTTGNFGLYGIPEDVSTIIVSAPGYYSQARAVEHEGNHIDEYDFQLVRRPETQNLSWGTGQVFIPQETQVSIDAQHLTLIRGWLWGEGGDSTPLTITAAGSEIKLLEATFALEYLPGEVTWLYMISGQASVISDSTTNPVVVTGGQMLSLAGSSHPAPVPLDPTAVRALHFMTETPIVAVWEPNLATRLQNGLAQIGVSTAQLITFVTYMAVLLSLVGLPVVGLKWWHKQRRSARKRDHNNVN